MSILDPTNLVYYYIILYGLYGMIFAPYIGAKIFAKLGKNERFWFYLLVFFNIYLFIGVLFYPDFRAKCSLKDKLKIILIIFVYLLIYSIVLWF